MAGIYKGPDFTSTYKNQLNDVTTTVNNTSGSWDYQGTDLKALSAGWQSTYLQVSNLSADWATHFDATDIIAASGSWNSVYSTVNTNSATTWNYQGTDLKDLSANWESTYAQVSTLSATWNSHANLTDLIAASGGWDSAYSTVNTNSATTWNYQGTDLKSLSAGWASTQTTVNANSATWEGDFCNRTINVNSISACTGTLSLDGALSVSGNLSAGSIRVGPNNTDTFYLTDSATVWNDVVVPLNVGANAGRTDSARLLQWGTGTLFVMKFQNGYFQTWPIVQIPHDWKGTRVYPHVHWCADTASTGEQVVWGLEITWAGLPNGLWKPNSTLTYYATAQTAGQYVQVITDIPAEGILPETFNEGASSISSIMACRLFLDVDQTTPAIVDGVSFDVHYEVDSLGSENVVQKFYA